MVKLACFGLINGNQPLENQFPELFSFARKKDITVSRFFSQQSLQKLFALPLSVEAFQQLQVVQELTNDYALTDRQDVWSSQWENFLPPELTGI